MMKARMYTTKKAFFVKALCLSMMIVCFVAMASSAKASQTVNTVVQKAQKDRQETREATNKIEADIAAAQQTLQKERNAIVNKVEEQKALIETLQQEFAQLKELEQSLKNELANKEDMMDAVQSTVGNNAGLFIQSAPSYIVQNLSDEEKTRIETLSLNKEFPKLEEIGTLLKLLQQSLAQSANLKQYEETIATREGKEIAANVLHLGAFQGFYQTKDRAEQGYTIKDTLFAPLSVATYTPDDKEKALLEQAFSGGKVLPVDVSKGAILTQPRKVYSLYDTIRQSGVFGWCILALGMIAILLTLERCFVLLRIQKNGKTLVNAVIDGNYTSNALEKTPSGRVLAHMMGKEVKQNMDPQILELRAEEAVLKELQPLERFLQTLKIIAAISPLLGLLGTVSGIVLTFRVITDFGNGDPKLLSGGISEALLTTEMGLLVAIPILFVHHFLQNRVNAVMLDMDMASTTFMRHFSRT